MIPSEKLFTVVSLLGLEQMNNNITIGFNLKSKKLGTKGIIKIADDVQLYVGGNYGNAVYLIVAEELIRYFDDTL